MKPLQAKKSLRGTRKNTLTETIVRTRKKRRHVDQKQWKKNKNNILRQEGQ